MGGGFLGGGGPLGPWGLGRTPGICEHCTAWSLAHFGDNWGTLRSVSVTGSVWSYETRVGNNPGMEFRWGSGDQAARSGQVTAEAAVRGVERGWGLWVAGMRPRCGAGARQPGESAGRRVPNGVLSGLVLGDGTGMGVEELR